MTKEIKFSTDNSLSFVSPPTNKITFKYQLDLGGTIVPISSEIDLSNVDEDMRVDVFNMVRALILNK